MRVVPKQLYAACSKRTVSNSVEHAKPALLDGTSMRPTIANMNPVWGSNSSHQERRRGGDFRAIDSPGSSNATLRIVAKVGKAACRSAGCWRLGLLVQPSRHARMALREM